MRQDSINSEKAFHSDIDRKAIIVEDESLWMLMVFVKLFIYIFWLS